MSDATVRSVAEADIPALVSVVADLHEWFNRDVPEQVRADCSRCAGLVAEMEGTIVGFVLGLRKNDVCEIAWLAVVRGRHRQGIGSLLIGALLHIAREAGAARVAVETLAPTHDYEPYARSRAFYEARGFELASVEPGGFPEGSDKATYVLDLA